MEVKPLGKIAEKWRRRATAAAGDYKEGVQTTRKDQAACAIAAEGSYEAGVSEAIGRKAFSAGLRESGHGKWREKAVSKGSVRYPGGVADAEPEYNKGFAPHHAALEGLVLPPRGPRGSPGNLERVRLVDETLHRVRIGG